MHVIQVFNLLYVAIPECVSYILAIYFVVVKSPVKMPPDHAIPAH